MATQDNFGPTYSDEVRSRAIGAMVNGDAMFSNKRNEEYDNTQYLEVSLSEILTF